MRAGLVLGSPCTAPPRPAPPPPLPPPPPPPQPPPPPPPVKIVGRTRIYGSLPPLPRSLAPPCLPCVEGRQRPAPHSSSFPPTTAPLQTLHMDVWGPARVSGQGGEHYFLLVVDDYTRCTTVFPLQSKADCPRCLDPLDPRCPSGVPSLWSTICLRASSLHALFGAAGGGDTGGADSGGAGSGGAASAPGAGGAAGGTGGAGLIGASAVVPRVGGTGGDDIGAAGFMAATPLQPPPFSPNLPLQQLK
ncbi:unnamed protein product [Closterium sp. NIES-53]